MKHKDNQNSQQHVKKAMFTEGLATLLALAVTVLGARPMSRLAEHLPLPEPPIQPKESVLRNLGMQAGLHSSKNKVKELQSRLVSDYLYDKLMTLNSPKGYENLFR